MKNTFFILLALSSLALVSCEDFFSQTVEIDPPPYDKQLSFHLNLTDRDSAVQLVLTRNFGILETVPNSDDYFVNGGSAELYKDGQKWLTLAPASADSGFVLVGELPEPLQSGSTYEIRAAHPDDPMVSAVQTMPADFVVDSARVKRNAISGQFGDEFDLVDVFLKDQPGVRNYYEITIVVNEYYISVDPITGLYDTVYTGQQYTRYVDEYPDPNVEPGFDNGGLLSDQFFDGQAYKFQAKIYSGSNNDLLVRVRNITEEYYRWSRSYQAKYDAEENPFFEPVSVFDNLVDGLGIFSVARERVFEVR
ncbi:MAG: DUF4249 family protein [Saprospiraceae bacterium]